MLGATEQDMTDPDMYTVNPALRHRFSTRRGSGRQLHMDHLLDRICEQDRRSNYVWVGECGCALSGLGAACARPRRGFSEKSES